MIRIFEEGGKEMVAVVLGDTFNYNPERYRDSLLNVINAAMLNDGLYDGSPQGDELSDCLQLARAMEQTPPQWDTLAHEKGGTA